MKSIEERELTYQYYFYSYYKDGDPHVSGPADSTDFNKYDRLQVLYIINYLIEVNKIVQNKADLMKLERLLRVELPKRIETQSEVVNWILKNWEKKI